MSHDLLIRALVRLVAALTLSAATLFAAPLDQWHWRSPLPQGNPLRSVAYGNGLYTAVGDLGTILTSTDTTNWTRQTSGTTSVLRDCVFGGGQWVVVGDFGTVLTSPDGRLWTAEYPGTFFSLNAVTYGNGQFVAVGNATTIITSSDGVAWTTRSAGPFDLFDVIYAEGLYVAVGRGSILNSTDGFVWRTSMNPNAFLVSLAYGDGIFAAAARYSIVEESAPELWVSNDGFSWQPREPNVRRWSDLRVGYGGGTWVLAGGQTSDIFGRGDVAISTNLETWVEVITNAAPVSAVVYQKDKFVGSRTDGTVLVSSDGRDWSNPGGESFQGSLYDLEYADGRWLGLADEQQLLGSADGIMWTNIARFEGDFLEALAYGNGTSIVASFWRVWVSTNMVHWTNISAALGNQAASIADVTFGEGLFVAVSGFSGGAFASPDAINWSRTLGSSAAFQAVAHGNDRFVAVGGEHLATSADGTNWHLITTNYINMTAVTSGRGRFVAVGPYGSMTTLDGTNWLSTRLPQFRAFDVAYGNGFFVAVGSQSNAESPIWVSQDGLTWSQRNSHTARSLSSVAFGDGKFLIGGIPGVLLESDPLVTLTAEPGAQARLLLSGPSRRSYRLERSDSADGMWTDLGTIYMENGQMLFSDPQSFSTGFRFYRAMLLP